MPESDMAPLTLGPQQHTMNPMAKTTSRESFPDALRKTEAVKLRLDPEVADRLRRRATAAGVTLSDYVAALIPSREPKVGDRITWLGRSGSTSYSGVVELVTNACEVYASVDGKPGRARVPTQDIVSVVSPAGGQGETK